MSESTYKVQDMADKYDIEDYDFEELWTGSESLSLRDLAEQFNIKIVKSALANAGEPEDEQPQYIFRVLTGGIGTEETRKAQESRLQEKGIDTEELREDFVSYSAVRRYLVEYLGVYKDTSPSESEAIDNLKSTANKLESRCRNVILDHITRLDERGIFSITEPALSIDFNLYCEECGKELRLAKFIKQRECDCEN